jgi:hypothetical protein
MTPEQLRTLAEWAGWNPRYVDGDIIAYDGEKGHEEYAWLGDKGKERITAEGAFDLLRVARSGDTYGQIEETILSAVSDYLCKRTDGDLSNLIGEAVYQVIGGYHE